MESNYNRAEAMSTINNILEEVFQLKEVILQAQAKSKNCPPERIVPLTLSQQIRMGFCRQSTCSQPTEQTYMTYIHALNKTITAQKEENKKMKEKMNGWLYILKSEGYNECNKCGAAIPNVGEGHICPSTPKSFFTR